MARVHLDTGTVGTNLMSSNWAQANQMPTTKMQQPCEIRMATKNSRATANHSAEVKVDIGRGRTVDCSYIFVPIGSYDIVLGMSFMTKARVILDTEHSTAAFKGSGAAMQCSNTEMATACAATEPLPDAEEEDEPDAEMEDAPYDHVITPVKPAPDDDTASEDDTQADNNNRNETDSKMTTIGKAIALSAEILTEDNWYNEVRTAAEKLLTAAGMMIATVVNDKQPIPNFKKE